MLSYSFSGREEEMDGEWEAPKIPNPACKDAIGCGKWTPPLVSNPAHKGKWKPPMIANPNYQVTPSISGLIVSLIRHIPEATVLIITN